MASEEVMCKQRPEIREPPVERAFWGEWKPGQRPQVFSEEQEDLCKELDFILIELGYDKLQELPHGLKEATAIMEMRDGSGLN